MSPAIKDVTEVFSFSEHRATARHRVAIGILVSAAVAKSTRSTQARGCLRTIMHDNIKASSTPPLPSSVPLNCYLELKAAVPFANIILGVVLVQILEIPAVSFQWFQSRLMAVFRSDLILGQVQIEQPACTRIKAEGVQPGLGNFEESRHLKNNSSAFFKVLLLHDKHTTLKSLRQIPRFPRAGGFDDELDPSLGGSLSAPTDRLSRHPR